MAGDTGVAKIIFSNSLGTEQSDCLLPARGDVGVGIGSVDKAEEYRRTAWDCLKLAEASSNPETRATMVRLAQECIKFAKESERNNQSKLAEYKAKGYAAWARGYRNRAHDCMTLAARADDPERRADLLLFGELWTSLTEPVPELPGCYELSSATRRYDPTLTDVRYSALPLPL